MSSSPEGPRPPRPSHVRGGTPDGADRGTRPSVLLRGASATAAAPYRSVPGTTVPPRPRPEPRQAGPSPVVATAPEVVVERRGTVRRAADVPVPNGRGVRRLGDVYAEELARLREFARAEGYDAGYAEGLAEASRVVARAEADAAAHALAADREHLVSALRTVAGVEVRGAPAASFVLVRTPGRPDVRQRLRERGLAVRRGDTFPGLDGEHVRIAVRSPRITDALVTALQEVLA